MYCTIEDVKWATGRDVTAETVQQAQFVMEIYTGRPESMVDGVSDLALLQRATIAQAVYMSDHGDMIWEQISASQIGQGQSLTTFKAGDTTSPWIAPLAVMACSRLSWNRARNVHTGRIFQRRGILAWRKQ